jgi:hypothetical protein
VATPLLTIFLLGLAAGVGGRNGLTPTGTLVPLGLILGVLGSCWQLITVRRARWEVARIEGASFAATQAREFGDCLSSSTVLLQAPAEKSGKA